MPALIGRGRVLLELDRDAEALASFEAALATDPSLTELRSRVDVLRFRAVQDMLGRAKAAAEARRWDEAATIYRQAIATSPDSAFLYRDLAAVEQKAGQNTEALEHYRKAVELDANDARSLAGIGAILEAQGDVLGALASYERARAIDADEVPESVMARLRGAAALAKLPAEYRAIPDRTRRSRVRRSRRWSASGSSRCWRARSRARRSSPTFAGIGRSRGSAPVVRSGVMDTLANYEFEPRRQVRRGELATTVSRLLSADRVDQAGAGDRSGRARASRSTTSRRRT